MSDRDSVFDALDLDPSQELGELAERLAIEASVSDPARRELCRVAFERLSASPEHHFLEIVASVPRRAPDPARAARRPAPALELSAEDLMEPPAFAARLPRSELSVGWSALRAPVVEVVTRPLLREPSSGPTGGRKKVSP